MLLRNNLPSRPSAAAVVLAYMASALFIAGCSRSDRVPVYPVLGQVLVKGQPAVDAMVIFHPQGDSERLEKLRPYGRADEAGNFKLSTYTSADGAPVGTYKVTIEWRKAVVDPKMGKSQAGPDLLNGAYSDASTSPFTVEISKGNNELAPLEID